MNIEDISLLVQGKSIAQIRPSKTDWGDGWDIFLAIGDYDADGGPIDIVFEDGSHLTVSASEWGAIRYIRPKQPQR